MKKFLIIICLFCGPIIAGCQQIKTTNSTPATNKEETNISSFEECITAGFPVIETYPRQCNDGKNTFTETPKELTGNTETLTGDIENTIDILENTTGDNQNLSGDVEDFIENTGTIQETTNENEENNTGTNLILLQQKLKASLERRNQESENKSGKIETSETSTIKTTNEDGQINEDDIEYLENVIEKIIE